MTEELKVKAIEEGTVIDHLPSDKTFKVVDLLDLEGEDNGTVSVATNLESESQGRKGIIKVGGKELTSEEVDKIALVAPEATVNIIEDYDVVEKERVEIPDELVGIIKCNNPNCITNNEDIETKFLVLDKDDLNIECYYCERVSKQGDIEVE